MTQLSSRRPSHRKGDGRSLSASSAIVPLGALSLNPASVDVEDGERVRRVTVVRLNGAHARVSCTCDAFADEDWCRHCVQVLCLDPTILSGLEPPLRAALPELVSGLPISADARALAAAQESFAASLRRFDAERPDGITGEKLSIFTELVSDLAVTSSELEDAIGRFHRSMEGSKRFVTSARVPAVTAD
jgi:hypothetical protein